MSWLFKPLHMQLLLPTAQIKVLQTDSKLEFNFNKLSLPAAQDMTAW
jgi:hypothetical protein